MSRVTFKAALVAFAIHGSVLLFGGLLLRRPATGAAVREDVELMADDGVGKKDDETPPEKKAAEQEPAEAADRMNEEAQAMPDLHDLTRLESEASGPALAPLSLSDLEATLNPGAGGEDGGFGGGGALTSGGRIGASGGPAAGASFESILSVGDLDQRPRAILQTPPVYPAELRKRHVQGTVEIVFLVNTEGKVVSPRVEKSTDPAFETPALEAVRQWRFEAGTRNGEKVPFRLRIPITFSAG